MTDRLDLTRPVQTECGGKAEVLATDLDVDPFRLVARYKPDGYAFEKIGIFDPGGAPHSQNFTNHRLVNVPETVKVTICIFNSPESSGGFYIAAYRSRQAPCSRECEIGRAEVEVEIRR